MKTIRQFLIKIRKNQWVKGISYISLFVFPLFCLFVLDYFNYYHYSGLSSVRFFIEHHPLSFVFEVLVMLVLFLFLLLLFRDGAVTCTVFGVLSFLFAYINYVKVDLNGDNFFPRDILMTGEAGELVSFISNPLPKWFYLSVAILIVYLIFLYITKPMLPGRWFIRYPIALIMVIVCLVTFSNSQNSKKFLNKFDMYFEDSVLQSSNYKANGFVGAFMINVFSMNVEKPENYSQDLIETILAPYEETPTDKTAELYDVIVVLSESFFDARQLNGVEFSENPLPNYDEILTRDNCYSGSVFTTAIGGGTVRPEFEILTGLITDYLPSGASPYEYVADDIDTYVSNYKEAGYRTGAIHLYDKTFYSRDDAYGHIGFDEYYALDDLKGLLNIDYKRGYATDESTLAAMKDYLEQSDQPAFLSAITIQNHQSYNAIDEKDIQIDVQSDVLDEDTLTALTTYTQGLRDADIMLKNLVDYIDQRERPTVLLFYGDHLPTLGPNYAAYQQTGFFGDTELTDTRERMYSTPFLIYSNREIHSNIFKGHTGNKVSTYHLLNIVADVTGFQQTSYMNLLQDFYHTQPYYNVRLLLPENQAAKQFYNDMRYIAYDRLAGKHYSS